MKWRILDVRDAIVDLNKLLDRKETSINRDKKIYRYLRRERGGEGKCGNELVTSLILPKN